MKEKFLMKKQVLIPIHTAKLNMYHFRSIS